MLTGCLDQLKPAIETATIKEAEDSLGFTFITTHYLHLALFVRDTLACTERCW